VNESSLSWNVAGSGIGVHNGTYCIVHDHTCTVHSGVVASLTGHLVILASVAGATTLLDDVGAM
jgi:hypothetical protein